MSGARSTVARSTPQRERAAPARDSRPAPRSEAALHAPSTGPGLGCACGGGCPRCVGTGEPLDAALREDMEARFGQSFGQVRIHAGPEAARSALALNAHAYTLGSDIAFAPGRYAPHSGAGRRLLAHELAHVVQQQRSGRLSIQRDAITMEPLVVTSTRRPAGEAIGGLGALTGVGHEPGEISLGRGAEDVQRNAPDPARVLPFTPGGWNADDILTALGQYDTLPGTDSDAIRCVQAVAMAARIPDGPEAVTGFLRASILDCMMSRPRGPRERAAIDVIEHVIGRIDDRRATFGDLMWTQEALHDLFYNDVTGTPDTEILNRISPALDLGMRLERMNVWCNDASELMAQAAPLGPGEKLLVNTWEVAFNEAFEQLEEQGVTVPVGQSRELEVNGRRARIRRIATETRPAHTAIDPSRDTRSGHQLLVFKDSVTGALRLYEPEITESGQHLEPLAGTGSNLARYFRDLPAVGVYSYVQILGKLVPSGLGASRPEGP